jgi:acyl-CoA reductase-like NAD-dependent aldehyde dehydrogenase
VAFKSINPHNPSEVIGEFEEAGQFDVEIAVVRAREAFFDKAFRKGSEGSFSQVR